jgi:hypothetical protein
VRTPEVEGIKFRPLSYESEGALNNGFESKPSSARRLLAA